MPSKRDPADSLQHIIDNAERIARYLACLDRSGFAQNEAVRDAVERCLERICEAAHRLDDQAEQLMPGQPWRDIRGMGNRLRHAYDRINVDIIWTTAQTRVPALAAAARLALGRLSSNSAPE